MVRKFNDGNYVLLTIESDGTHIAELERRLRVTEPVIKFITVRTDEEEKRIAKAKANRGVRRSAVVPVSAPAPVAAPVAAAPVAEAPVAVAAPVADAPAEAAEPAPTV
jgi:small subunit ribosomal protein S6